nr:hypothetical protein [Tanacetum cinerariifolium]
GVCDPRHHSGGHAAHVAQAAHYQDYPAGQGAARGPVGARWRPGAVPPVLDAGGAALPGSAPGGVLRRAAPQVAQDAEQRVCPAPAARPPANYPRPHRTGSEAVATIHRQIDQGNSLPPGL